MRTEPFVPPPYPFDRLDAVKATAVDHPLGMLNLSIGAPHDPPPAVAIQALATSGNEAGYPPCVGTPGYRDAAAAWLNSIAGTNIEGADAIAIVGAKELVAGLPHWLRLRRPDLDTVLYPAVSYPSYELGAQLAGCRAVPVPLDDEWRMDLSAISAEDAKRALCLWNASPGNPTGAMDDLGELAAWGRAHDVPVFSDECYIEFTWDRPATSMLEHGSDGVVAVHSLSKRSNFAGARAGFIAGDREIVDYLGKVRQHAGLLVSAPVQNAAIAAWGDPTHVAQQRERYRERMTAMIARLADIGVECAMPSGGFYLWFRDETDDGWALADRLATELGVVGTPGEFYGEDCHGWLRLAMVQDVHGR